MTYTPTTDEVDTGFTTFAYDLVAGEPDAYGENSGFEDYHEVCAAFRRWLAEERAKVWDEAIDAQHETDRDWESYISSHDERPKPPKKALNPYRKETP